MPGRPRASAGSYPGAAISDHNAEPVGHGFNAPIGLHGIFNSAPAHLVCRSQRHLLFPECLNLARFVDSRADGRDDGASASVADTGWRISADQV